MTSESFVGGAVKLFAMVRMGDADKQLCAFLERFAVEVYCSVFSHYIMYMRS